jgi:hypothetical protein
MIDALRTTQSLKAVIFPSFTFSGNNEVMHTLHTLKATRIQAPGMTCTNYRSVCTFITSMSKCVSSNSTRGQKTYHELSGMRRPGSYAKGARNAMILGGENHLNLVWALKAVKGRTALEKDGI